MPKSSHPASWAGEPSVTVIGYALNNDWGNRSETLLDDV